MGPSFNMCSYIIYNSLIAFTAVFNIPALCQANILVKLQRPVRHVRALFICMSKLRQLANRRRSFSYPHNYYETYLRFHLPLRLFLQFVRLTRVLCTLCVCSSNVLIIQQTLMLPRQLHCEMFSRLLDLSPYVPSVFSNIQSEALLNNVSLQSTEQYQSFRQGAGRFSIYC